MPACIRETYLSLAAFYASDPARRRSRERGVGLFWRSRRGPSFRAAWVHETGEMHLFQHALGGRGGGSVHLLDGTFDREDLERRIVAWQDECGTPGSVDWLLERMGPDREPAAPPRLCVVAPAPA